MKLPEDKESGLRKKLEKLRPDELTVNLGVVSASYATKSKKQRVASSRHMKELARVGFAGILLQVISALCRSGDGKYYWASPIRIGCPLPDGIPTSNIVWIPSYAWELWSLAFEDYEDDSSWRRYPKRFAAETKALELAPFAEQHLRDGYPQISSELEGIHSAKGDVQEVQSAEREIKVRTLAKELQLLRLKVTSGKPLEGKCDLCS